MRSNPWKVAAIGLGVVLVAALALGAFLLGRGSGVGGTRAAEPSPPGVTAPPAPSSTTPAADPSATTGDAIPRGTVTAGAGGIPDGPGGLHTHYPRTTDGAVAAATNYLTAVYTDATRRDAGHRVQLAKTMAASPAVEAELRAGLDAYAGQYKDSGTAVHPERGAYAVASNGPDQVKVIVWVPACGTECGWAMQSVVVVWAQEDWKLYDPNVVGETLATSSPRDPMGAPRPDEKFRLVKEPPASPQKLTPTLNEAYKLAWREYANAAR